MSVNQINVVPPLAVGGESAFLRLYKERLTDVSEGTKAAYYNHVKRMIGNGTVQVCMVKPVYGEDQVLGVENQLRLSDLPPVLPSVLPSFVDRVAWRHCPRKTNPFVTNGAVECAFKKIYQLFPEKTSDVEWTTLFPLSEPEDADDEIQNVGGEMPLDEEDEEDEEGDDEDDMQHDVVLVDREEPTDVVVAEPPRRKQHTFVVAGKRVAIADLALGTAIIGDPGSGKTWMLKHLVDATISQIDSMKNIVIIDFKGDLSQMVSESPSGDASSCYDGVFFEIMTFGSAVGTWATLCGFDKRIIDKLESINLSATNALLHRDAARFSSIAKGLAQDVLLDVIVKTKEGKERLGGGMDVPSAKDRRTLYGTFSAKDEGVLAERLSTAIIQIFLKCRKAKVSLPRSYEDLLAEINCATMDRCRVETPTGEHVTAIDQNSLEQEDLDFLAKQIGFRAADVSWSALYRPESVGDESRGANATVALSGERLLAAPPDGYRRRVTIVNAALFGIPGVDDFKRRTIASTVITRMERQATTHLEGSQECPTSMLIIDEASFVMPNSTSKATGPDVSAVVAVKNILKLHRDKGMSVVLATQRPKDLHTELRSVITGMRMIGKFNGDPNEKKMVMEGVVKEEALRTNARKMLTTLAPHQFVMVNGGKVEVVRSKPLKRLHESSKKWAQPDEFTIDDLMSEDRETSDAAQRSHPLAPFTRNVRARFE
jgi:hypothetical protein